MCAAASGVPPTFSASLVMLVPVLMSLAIVTKLAPRRLAAGGRRRLGNLAALWRDARLAGTAQGVSPLRILLELLALNLKYPLGVRRYFEYRLFDRRLTWAEKSSYIGDTPAGNQRLWKLLTPDHYQTLFANKLIFQGFFASMGLPLPELYGVYDAELGHTAKGESLKSASDLRRWMETFPGEGLVVKPIWGGAGHQILILAGRAAGDRCTFVTLDGHRYGPERLAQFMVATQPKSRRRDSLLANLPGAFLLQERLKPHRQLAEFIGPTLCTVRVQSIIALGGQPRLVAAVFKIQPEPIGVDHMTRGAVGCWVDLASGTITRGRTRRGYEEAALIPGTDTSFIGFQLPEWENVKELALRSAAAFPWARSIGWDIAITDRGAVLIEGNWWWSPSHIQIPAPHGLMMGEFKELCRALQQREQGGGESPLRARS